MYTTSRANEHVEAVYVVLLHPCTAKFCLHALGDYLRMGHVCYYINKISGCHNFEHKCKVGNVV